MDSGIKYQREIMIKNLEEMLSEYLHALQKENSSLCIKTMKVKMATIQEHLENKKSY